MALVWKKKQSEVILIFKFGTSLFYETNNSYNTLFLYFEIHSLHCLITLATPMYIYKKKKYNL
jgi:hypothetical protein